MDIQDSNKLNKNVTNSPNYIILDQTIVMFEKPKQLDNNHQGPQIATYKGDIVLFSKKSPAGESIDPNSQQAEVYIGPVSVVAYIVIIHEQKILDQIPVLFRIMEGIGLTQAFQAFITDFIHIYGYISKILNPQNQKYDISEIRITDPFYQVYAFFPLKAMEEYYEMIQFKKPEWLKEFYLTLSKIKALKNSINSLGLSSINLMFENPQPCYNNDKQGELVNYKGDLLLSNDNNALLKTIDPRGEQAANYKGYMVVELAIQIMLEEQIIDRVVGHFEIRYGVNLKNGFQVFINDFAHIYQSISKVLNPEAKKIQLSRFQTSNTSSQFYGLFPLQAAENFYKIKELEKPEWLEEFYVKVREIHQIQGAHHIKKLE